MTNENILNEMESVPVDLKQLSTNFPDVVNDCCGIGADPATTLANENPLYNWLLNTQLSNRVRSSIADPLKNSCVLHKDSSTGKYVIEIPGKFWSLPAQDSSGECCWPVFDFAKCNSNVPVNRLCLKDCDNLDDIILGSFQKMGASYGEFARKGENYNVVKDRIARLSMAFLTANNAILGTDHNTTDILKPFHGLLQVMMNPAVISFEGTNILSAFYTLWCYLHITNNEDVVFATNKIIYESIATQIQPGQNGRLPDGWTREGNEIRFHGIRFIQDHHVPVDTAAGTGDVWVLNGSAVGLWMAADLLNPIKRPTYIGNQFFERTLAEGCGEECKWWYNYGAAFNNRADKLATITNVPISAYCVAAAGRLGDLIAPTTLVPKI